MASRPEGLSRLSGFVATALAALCWWFGSGVQPVWWLSWLAPLPVLWLAPRVRARWSALAAFVAYAMGGCNLWEYMHGYIGLPLPVIASAIGLPALVLALCALLYRRLLLRGHALAAAAVVPALWVAAEYANSLVSPHGTYGNIAYTQMNALAVIQIAAVGGIWIIGFLVLLVPAALAMQTCPQVTKRARVAVAAVAAASIVVTAVYGGWRLHEPAQTSMRIGLVSLEKPIRPVLDDKDGQALQARYIEAIGKLADAGAQVVVIPETSFSTTGTSIPAFAELATKRNLILGAGIDFKGDAHAERNMLMVFRPTTMAPAIYSKRHLIPGFEHQYTPGNSYTRLDGSPRIGLAVCKDMDFHDISSGYAAQNTQLLLVPAWDFSVDGWLHSRMAIMRGVESGFAIARAARSGRLTLSDDRGRVVAEASSEKHDASLLGTLPLHDTQTLYARWGDWFVWLDLIALVVCLAMALLPRRATGT